VVKKIDLLKMNIGAGEYEILADARFDELNTSPVVMEWHARSETFLGVLIRGGASDASRA
jgi:hypothetical protein